MGQKISQTYGSGRYLKAADIPSPVTWTIKGSSYETMPDGSTQQVVISFNEDQRVLGLNKTNAGRIADLHGDDTDQWAGKQITIRAETTEYQGRVVPCVRVVQNGMPPVMGAAPVAPPTVTGPSVAPAVPVPGSMAGFNPDGSVSPPVPGEASFREYVHQCFQARGISDEAMVAIVRDYLAGYGAKSFEDLQPAEQMSLAVGIQSGAYDLAKAPTKGDIPF